MSFSTARTIPSLTRRPIAVLNDTNSECDQRRGQTDAYPEFSTALLAYSTLMAHV